MIGLKFPKRKHDVNKGVYSEQMDSTGSISKPFICLGPEVYGGKMCGIGIESTSVVFFGIGLDRLGQNLSENTMPEFHHTFNPFYGYDASDYLSKFVLDTKSWQWIEVDFDFINIKEFGISKQSLDLSCTAIIDKALGT